MRHRTKERTKWVGLSPDLCRTLCGIFFQLYRKKHSELNPLEVELKFFSPLAADWDIKVWAAKPKELVLERAKKIVEFRTLKPLGLNNSLKFTNKEVWEEFTGWFVAQRRQHSWLYNAYAYLECMNKCYGHYRCCQFLSYICNFKNTRTQWWLFSMILCHVMTIVLMHAYCLHKINFLHSRSYSPSQPHIHKRIIILNY